MFEREAFRSAELHDDGKVLLITAESGRSYVLTVEALAAMTNGGVPMTRERA